MARSGFVKNSKGFREVLNESPEIREYCHRVGGAIEQTANSSGHGTYTHDTIRGRARFHTRVKTADSKSFFQERYHRTLAKWAQRRAGG